MTDVAYHGRKQWIDKAKLIPLKEELYAKGGKLLKRTVLSDVKKIEDKIGDVLIARMEITNRSQF